MQHLVTGGAGFIGSHLTDALVARGDDVVILDDLSTGRLENIEHLTETDRVTFVEGSVLDEGLVDDLMATAERCFHLASSVGVKLIVSQPLESVRRTVRGCEVVMGSSERHGVRLLFTSTSEIYGKNPGDGLREEDDRILGPPTMARWSYSTAKAFGEILACGYARDRGAEMVVARLFNTVGPRQTGAYGMVLPRFVRQALDGDELVVYGNGTQSRCFAHVHDSVDALLRLAGAEGGFGKAYNVGSTDEITVIELARRVIEYTGTASAIRLLSYEEAYGEGFEELGRRKPNCSAIEELTGWTPTRTVDDAIEDVVAHLRETARAAA